MNESAAAAHERRDGDARRAIEPTGGQQDDRDGARRRSRHARRQSSDGLTTLGRSGARDPSSAACSARVEKEPGESGEAITSTVDDGGACPTMWRRLSSG